MTRPVVWAAGGGVVLFLYSIYAVGLSPIANALARLGWAFVAVLAISGARELVRAVAWMQTIEGPVALSFPDALRARLAGEALNSLLPMGMLIGEAAKAQHVDHRLPFATAFKGLAIEFSFYGVSLMLLFAAGVVAWVPASAAALAGALAVLAAVSMRKRIRLPRRVGEAVARLRRLAEPVIGFASRSRARAWRILALEGTYHVLGIGEVYLILSLLSPFHVAWRSAVILETVNRAVTMAFKMLPMRIGIDEAGAAMFANSLNLGAPTGVMLALVRKLRLLFWSAVGLIFVLMRSITLRGHEHSARDYAAFTR